MNEKTRDMLGIYLIFQYLLGAAVAMILFGGFKENPPIIAVILAFVTFILGGILTTDLLAEIILRGCGNE